MFGVIINFSAFQRDHLIEASDPHPGENKKIEDQRVKPEPAVAQREGRDSSPGFPALSSADGVPFTREADTASPGCEGGYSTSAHRTGASPSALPQTQFVVSTI